MSDKIDEFLKSTFNDYLAFSKGMEGGEKVTERAKEILKNFNGKEIGELSFELSGYLVAFMYCVDTYGNISNATITDIPNT